MPRALHRLTALKASRLTTPGYHPDGAGLYLQIAASGTKSWIYRYTLAGKQREMGLGSYADYTLAEAREAAQTARKLRVQGIDPIEQRKTQKAALASVRRITFAAAAKAFIEANESGWDNAKHAQQWRSTLATYAEPKIGRKDVSTITLGDILDVLQPIWNTKNETASRLRGRIEKVLDWATVQEYRAGPNPARWKGNLDAALPKPSKVQDKSNHGALDWRSMHAFYSALGQQTGSAAAALRLIILTACRTSEAIEAEWSEFDLEGAVWTIPAARMKARKEHRVPLSAEAVAVLTGLHAQLDDSASSSQHVFPGQQGKPHLSNMACLNLLKRMERTDITVHGFRSTFRDWAAEATAHPHDVCEMALAHTIPNKSEAAYRRGDLFDKRRALMQDWADYCLGARPKK